MREEPRVDRVARSEGERAADAQFAGEVHYYLSQDPRQLPSRYFYDALGSALFEAICELPWYRITGAELRLLSANGRQIAAAGPFTTLVELGPGRGQKMLALIESAGLSRSPIDVHLIDVSPSALTAASDTLAGLEAMNLVTHEAPYEVGLAEATAARRRAGWDSRALALFLGSNIGNFDPPGADAFLGGIRASLCKGDALLVGADLVKPERSLLLAYDDPLGVTAAFNRNLLVRINRELDGDFDIDAFAHRAVWNAEASRVEMHLVSRRPQRVNVAKSALTFTMDEGDTIWTESSYKYEPAQIVARLTRAGFRLVDQWVDAADRFALTLVEAV